MQNSSLDPIIRRRSQDRSLTPVIPMTRQTCLRKVALLATIAVAWTLAGCSIPPAPAAPTATTAPATVRIYAGPFLGSAPVYIAQAEGYFAEQGLNVELVPLKSSIDAVPALAQGDLDAVLSSANVALFNTIARGGSIRLVAGASILDPTGGCTSHGLVGRKDLVTAGKLQKPSQFRGLHLATGSLGIEGYYIDKYLQREGLSLADLQVDDVSPPAIGEALANGSLDAANAAEPWLTRILKEGNAELIVGAKDVIPNTNISVIAFGPTFLSEKPEVGRRFMAAVVRGVQKYQEGKTEDNVKIIAEFTGLEPELVKELCWPPASPGGSLNAESLVAFEQWALSKGGVDKVLMPDEFFDSSFADAAAQEGAQQ